jgi:hypothetical protein
MKHPTLAALGLAVAFVASSWAALAGPCSVQIAEFRSTLGSEDGQTATGTAPQTVSAQLGHQPTPASVEGAKNVARTQLDAALAEAENFDAEGKGTECAAALGKAKLLAAP